MSSVFWPETKFGQNLVAYIVYQIIELAVPQITVKHSLNKSSGLIYCNARCPGSKREPPTIMKRRGNILGKITRGDLAHVDETRANVKGKSGYVWVFTNLQRSCLPLLGFS